MFDESSSPDFIVKLRSEDSPCACLNDDGDLEPQKLQDVFVLCTKPQHEPEPFE